MKKYWNRLINMTNNKLRKPVSDSDIQGYRIIMSHINNSNSKSFYDSKLNEYIVVNKKTHYDLIISSNKVLLVNTKDIVSLEVCEDVRNRVIKRIIDIISDEMQVRKSTILDRKSTILDRISINVKK